MSHLWELVVAISTRYCGLVLWRYFDFLRLFVPFSQQLLEKIRMLTGSFLASVDEIYMSFVGYEVIFVLSNAFFHGLKLSIWMLLNIWGKRGNFRTFSGLSPSLLQYACRKLDPPWSIFPFRVDSEVIFSHFRPSIPDFMISSNGVQWLAYPLVNLQKTTVLSPFSMGFHPLFLWPFSIVMLVYQRVYPMNIPLNHYKIPFLITINPDVKCQFQMLNVH